ncbi:MAG: C25 family cysteine peptidase [Caldilineaceae bacterium]
MTSLHARTLTFLFLWLCALSLQPAAVFAQEGDLASPQIVQDAAAVSVTWTNRQPRNGDAPAWQAWPTTSVNGVDLPAQLITVQAIGDEAPEIVIGTLTSRAWTSRDLPFAATEPPTRVLITGEVYPPLTSAVANPQPPDSPVVLLRQGEQRGQRFVVLALTPIYAVDGEVREVSSLDFTVTGARLLGDGGVQASADWRLNEDVAGPSDISQQTALKVMVTKPGLQEIALRDVYASGLADADDVARLQLYVDADQVALEVDEAAGRLRFFAPQAGDRWNDATTYWLIRGDDDGLRMTQRAAADAGGAALPVRATAWETGEWSFPQLYVSEAAGPDGDHWFTDDLRSGPELPTSAVTLTTALGLPTVAGSAVMTITGHAYVGDSHTLDVVFTSAVGQDSTSITWQANNNWWASFSTAAGAYQVVATLASDDTPNALRVDDIEWRRPVALQFGGLSGYFETEEAARYQLSELPDDFAIYDVTEPKRPLRVQIDAEDSSAELTLDSEAGRRYLVAQDGLSTLYLPGVTGSVATARAAVSATTARLDRLSMRAKPTLTLHRPANLNSAFDAAVLYISHREFMSALAPLVLARKDQGYDIAVVDVQAIYDGWSGGQVSPQAIRAFLRYAAATGKRAPSAVTLIGDGTSDPRNYTGRNNVNYMPPYLAVVDLNLGEAACETCFGQLDGDDPLSDPLMDLMLGRIPAKSAAELTGYIDKLLPYESDTVAARARTGMLYVTDNYLNVDGPPDKAGDFAAASETSIVSQPSFMQIDRVYYDPVTESPEQPWRIADAVAAYEATLAALQKGLVSLPTSVTHITGSGRLPT